MFPRLAGIILVAHLGLAKSDLGTGYELGAITAVVLGGTSVFGGRGTLFGSLLGLVFLSVLQNGMHLLALPSELTGVFTGMLLLGIVGFEKLRSMRSHRTRLQEEMSRRAGSRGGDRIVLWAGAVVAIAILAAAFPILHSRLVARAGGLPSQGVKLASPENCGHAESQGRSIFYERPRRRRRGRARTAGRPYLGWANKPGCSTAK